MTCWRRLSSLSVCALSFLVFSGCPAATQPALREQPAEETAAPAIEPSRERMLDGKRYRCRYVAGTFTNVFKRGAECGEGGAQATCTDGRLSGDLEGSYAFQFIAQGPAGDPTAPARQTFIGRSDVRLDDGSRLTGHDFGDITFQPQGLSPFRTLIDVRNNDDRRDMRGHILARGQVDLSTGKGGGSYSGELCTPAK